MRLPVRLVPHPGAVLAAATVLVLSLSAPFSTAAAGLTQLSSDPYTNTTSQHQTQVEPDVYASGSTIVSAVQTGRFYNGGASNVAWATSTDNGATWTTGTLPGTTVYAGGAFTRVSDPSVAYDAAHKTWLIATLAIAGANVVGVGVLVNRSTDGGHTWSNAVAVTLQTTTFLDKDWITCDNTATSPYYGHCYTEWDDNGRGNTIEMSTSSDGGATWGAFKTTANNATGLGGQPLVQPNGTVIVPIDNAGETAVLAFYSVNGGASWSAARAIAAISSHTEAGNLRSGPLPTAAIDGAGTVYIVWQDCRFESRCSANDLVMVTLGTGTVSGVTRLPIDAIGSGVDHFIPGLGIDRTTSGSGAHLGLMYYYFPNTACATSTCQLKVGFVSSVNGGASWSQPTQLAGPLSTPWLANTSQGYMVGDYMATAIAADGLAHPVFSLASAPGGSLYRQALYSVSAGLPITGGAVGVTAADTQAALVGEPTQGSPRTAF